MYNRQHIDESFIDESFSLFMRRNKAELIMKRRRQYVESLSEWHELYRCSTATTSNRRTINELPYPYYNKWDEWISDSEVPVCIVIQYHSKICMVLYWNRDFFMFIYDCGDDENLTDSVASLEDANQVIVNAQ